MTTVIKSTPSKPSVEKEHDNLDNDPSVEYEQEEEKKSIEEINASNGTSVPKIDLDQEESLPHKTDKTHPWEKTCITWFSIFFLIYAIATVVSFAIILGYNDQTTRNYGNYVYYIALIIYQIAVIIVSFWSRYRYKELAKKGKSPAKTWYELVFYAKFTFCSLFNLITGILLIYGVYRDRKDGAVTDEMKPLWILMAITYLINVISIPFPGVILFEYLKTINANKKVPNRSRTSPRPRSKSTDPLLVEATETSFVSLRTTGSRKSDVSVLTPQSTKFKLNQNVYNDKFMLGGISFAYLTHFLAYILFPAVAEEDFNAMLKIMYIDNNTYDIFYNINHVVLRTFKGMSLNGLFFAFFAAVIAKARERASQNEDALTDWEYVKNLLHNTIKFWIVLISMVTVVLGVDIYIFIVDDTYAYIMDIIWIGVHVCGFFLTMFYNDRFKGAYDKYTKSYKNRFLGGKKLDNISYGFKALILLVLFIVQVVCLLNEDNRWTWARMLSMLGFAGLQIPTLIRLRKLQINTEYINWSKKFNRNCLLKWLYFRVLIFINISDLLYVYIFGYQYYSQDRLQDDKNIRISYAMSFSSSAIFTICVAQLIISYAEFRYASQKHNRPSSATGSATEMSESIASSQSGKSNKYVTATYMTETK